jgi:S-adenosylmethionine:tRNA ribosyltransferase-isomerase
VDPDHSLSSYDFALPASAIAQEPPAERGASRLFVLSRQGDGAKHSTFDRLGDELREGDLLVVNDTRVLAARIVLRRATGGRVRGLLLEAPRDDSVRAMLEGRGRLATGDRLTFEGGAVELAADLGGGIWELRSDAATLAALLASGRMPLPPYIERGDEDVRDDLDRTRYQTVFAANPGAVAAPTAGLHFDPGHLARLEAKGIGSARVTLHVGLGTFLPVRVEDLAGHRMHAETFFVPAETIAAIRATRERRGRVISVGTTVVRTLETWSLRGEPATLQGETDLFIRPGFEFRVVDALLTNFHLPKSTLLVLVAAFTSRERILTAYAEAVGRGYRFFSYGDAMFIA